MFYILWCFLVLFSSGLYSLLCFHTFFSSSYHYNEMLTFASCLMVLQALWTTCITSWEPLGILLHWGGGVIFSGILLIEIFNFSEVISGDWLSSQGLSPFPNNTEVPFPSIYIYSRAVMRDPLIPGHEADMRPRTQVIRGLLFGMWAKSLLEVKFPSI